MGCHAFISTPPAAAASTAASCPAATSLAQAGRTSMIVFLPWPGGSAAVSRLADTAPTAAASVPPFRQ
jgi:hypothetical protein